MKSKKTDINEAQINKKTKRQIAAVVISGFLIMLADIAAGASGGNIPVIEADGHMYMLRPDTGSETGYLYLTAKVETDEGKVDKSISVKLDPYEDKAAVNESQEAEEEDKDISGEERIGYELRSLADSFNKDVSLKRIELPQYLDTGEKISWEVDRQTNTLLIITFVMVLSVIIYKSRFAPLNRRKKEQAESVIRNLPEFVNRMVLLLNAGLVLNSAFEKTVEESISFHEGEDDYFTGKIHEIYQSMKSDNGSMHTELKRFARESGIKELIRVSNIINDNVSKGVELTDKLRNENEILWISRKKNCEERCRLAETKLTLPLMIFLIVLIVIVITPALLDL